MAIPDAETLHRITTRGVIEIIVEDQFVRLLKEGKPLRLKMGFDPSRPDIHLGHVVGLRKLRQLQELGHHLILIVGDWTAQIGDPSGASITRPMLTAQEVRANAESYMRQFFKVVDPQHTQAVYQSEWFGKFTLASVMELTSRFTVNQFLQRNDFAQRYAAGKPIAVTEMLYPLLQAYDSIAIESDVEFGGTDQKFNLLVGRDLQEKMGLRPQQCFIMPLIPGTDGVQKMSKSLDNYIAVEDPPNEMFGKVMSLPDRLILTYFELLTDVPDTDLKEIGQGLESGSAHPMELKKRLASEIVVQFHSANVATDAQQAFERVFQMRRAPTDVPELVVTAATSGVQAADGDGATVDVARFLSAAGLAPSRSEAKRLLDQGAVELDGQRVSEETARVAYGALLKVGRRRFLRIVKG